MIKNKKVFPFSAIIGHEDFKLSLILNRVDPLLGGVLAIGDKGTGKTTLIRSLVKLMEKENDLPFINLPIGVSEDRMLGHVDIEQLINTKKETVIPGLMAQAHGGVLYVDEINLLPDYLTDLLLDAAAQGSYYLEREGLSKFFSSRFTLIGSMNPEEGALRPQLKDRFGLSVKIETQRDPKLREQIIKRRLAFDDNPDQIIETFTEQDQTIAKNIRTAQKRLPSIKIGDDCISYAAKLAIQYDVEGHRAEILLIKAARAYTAYNNKKELSIEDIDKITPLVMNHRSTQTPPTVMPPDQEQENKDSHKNVSNSKPQEQYFAPLEPSNKFKNTISEYSVSDKEKHLRDDVSGGKQIMDVKKSVGQYLATDRFEVKQKRKSSEQKRHYIFLLDSSGSMLKDRLVSYAKGAVNKLANTVKKQSTCFSIISLFDGNAQTEIRKTAVLQEIEAALEKINTGGKTNLTAGFKHVKQLSSDEDYIHHLHVISDGKLNEGVSLEDTILAYQTFCKGISNCHIVDAENEIIKIGVASDLAIQINASYETLQTGNE